MTHPSRYRKILVLGSGALQIGQAGEFDYSGSQAMKALKEDEISTVLINPNIATIQTSPEFADKIYFLPLNTSFVQRVIEKERPDGLLLGFGGQTALNVGVELSNNGTLAHYGVDVLGTSVDAICKTEDRQLFNEEVRHAGFRVARSQVATTVQEALSVAAEIGYPVMCRIAYALGGLGSGLVQNEQEMKEKAERAFSHTQQILIEESLHGWKELEYEVVRDRYDNCISVCSMENLDPMGIHTGDSIVVAPVQTLSAREHFQLRSIAISFIRHLGIIGECNIQFALNPKNGEYRIIEVNARLSRSSALASKATGYPLAFIAAKLALGYGLHEIRNSITKQTSACFEPALDYIVVKFPRWDLSKFNHVSKDLGSEMKSVGEVMAIGRTFEEALQKAIRMLDLGKEGLTNNGGVPSNLDHELQSPTDQRIFAVAQAFASEYTLDRVNELTKIDHWFLGKIQNIVALETQIRGNTLSSLSPHVLRRAKQLGFSDQRIAELTASSEEHVRTQRSALKILPVVKQIDTLAAEYPAETNYLYLTYNGTTDDLTFETPSVVVLGSGAYRIGSSVEFDWCCVNTVQTLQALGRRTIMINCNPETVSTDYDICDRLYFEELTLERIRDIADKEHPEGLIISMGGQTPNNLAVRGAHTGLRILGTLPRDIDRAESRHTFSRILDELGIDQPEWTEVTTLEGARKFADRVGYPVLVRPSYVLSGAAMSIVLSASELETYIQRASEMNTEHPVVLTKFITDAAEIECDAVARDGEVICYAISEHIENAGVHSGDATLVLPPQHIYLETMRRIKLTSKQIAKALHITGPFNIQYIAKDNEIKVIECNLRASRSFPFVSKVLRTNFINIATRAIMGAQIPPITASSYDLDYVGVKAPQFSFTRLKGSDPVSGVEMASTGEAACLGKDLNEAFLKSIAATGFTIHPSAVLLSTGPTGQKFAFVQEAKTLERMGIIIYATEGTAQFLKENGIRAEVVAWPDAADEPNVMTLLSEKRVNLVINIPKNAEQEELDNDYRIRRKAVDLGISLITNLQFAKRYVKAISRYSTESLEIRSWDEY